MSHFFADDGQKIHVKVSGEGSPLIMLHGWTASHQEWFPFLPALTARHRVFRWDARGHGGHPVDNPQHVTVDRMAKDLSKLIEHFEIEDAVAVGHSMGALTLWEYVKHFGTKPFKGFCFIDQSPKLLTDQDWTHGIYGDFDQQSSSALLNRLQENFAEGVLELTALGLNSRAKEKYLANAAGWERSRGALRAQAPLPLIHCWQSLTEADYRATLPEIDIPSMLVYGGESNFYHLETARYVANQIRRSVLHVFEGTDHSPHQWQRDRFCSELLAFIDKL